jgi:hypothetical protein
VCNREKRKERKKKRKKMSRNINDGRGMKENVWQTHNQIKQANSPSNSETGCVR